jgi:hypothetical protein
MLSCCKTLNHEANEGSISIFVIGGFAIRRQGNPKLISSANQLCRRGYSNCVFFPNHNVDPVGGNVHLHKTVKQYRTQLARCNMVKAVS